MAQTQNASSMLRRAALSGIAVAAALAMPPMASAQDGGRRDGQRGDGNGGQVYHSRGERMGQMQQQRQWQPQGQAQVQAQAQAPAPQPQARPQRVDGWRGGDAGQRDRGMRNGPDTRGWTPQQWEAYRGAVFEGRDTNAFRNGANNRPSTWQTDRDGRPGDRRNPSQWQGQRDGNDRRDRNGWQNGGRGNDWRNNGYRGNDGREAWRNNGDWNRGRVDNRAWDRSWRNNNRYDWSSYRSRNRGIFEAGRYYSPYQNYSYRRLSIGVSLGSPFYGSRYWINDPYQYRLPEVYGPYRWVRYYDDVLLVDTYTGEVVDAIYDFFW